MNRQQALHIRTLLVGLFMLLWCVGSTQSASAHGIDRLLRQEKTAIGNRWVTVWSSPSRLRPGEVHIDLQLAQVDGTLSTAEFVQVMLMPTGEAQRAIAQPLPVTDPKQNPATHEARFYHVLPGAYEVVVNMAGPQGSIGSLTFAVEVTPVALSTQISLHVLLLLSLLAMGWLMRIGLVIWLPQTWLPAGWVRTKTAA